MRCSRSAFSAGLASFHLPLSTSANHAATSFDKPLSDVPYHRCLSVAEVVTVAPGHVGLSGSEPCGGPNVFRRYALLCSRSLSPKYTITVHSWFFQKRSSTVVGLSRPATACLRSARRSTYGPPTLDAPSSSVWPSSSAFGYRLQTSARLIPNLVAPKPVGGRLSSGVVGPGVATSAARSLAATSSTASMTALRARIRALPC